MTRRQRNALSRLEKKLPAGVLRWDPKTCAGHAGDKWFASHVPEVVALPKTTQAVSSLLSTASSFGIPVTARGSGHGYVGGCVPLQGGMVLSVARMKRIKEVHAQDFVAVVQPGVTTLALQEAAIAKGLFYPPDPASRADCSIGGNIATNAGGPSCLKYGVTRDYVLGLEVVTSNGDILRVGGRTHKNKTGFDFARLFVGSEGLLGVVTEATLKLLPRPPFRACLGMGFDSSQRAARAIQIVFAAGFLPCALEVADAFTLEAVQRRTGSKRLAGCRAYLFLELDGQEKSVRRELQEAARAIAAARPLFIQRAYGAAECEKLWGLRREFSYSLRDTGLTKLNEDIVVPRGRLLDLFAFADSLRRKYGLIIACFGHAGDGNIHVNLMVDRDQPEQVTNSKAALDELFARIVGWGGAITGEHGVGLAKMRWWPQAVSPAVRKWHVELKRLFDPRGILNPGKFV